MKCFEKLKRLGTHLWHGIKRAASFSHRQPWLQCTVIGLVLNFIIEVLHRHSISEGFMHIVDRPLPFLFNALIITVLMSFCTLFKKRYFFYSLFFCLFLGFGIGNGVLLTMRVTPLEWADLQVVKLSLFRIYLSTFEIILIIAIIAIAVIALAIFFVKCPKTPVKYLKNGLVSLGFTTALVVSLITFRSNGVLMSEHVKNLANAYKDYGFNYCFLCSALDLGIDKPSQYDRNDVGNIVADINSAAENNEQIKNNGKDKKPNIIFLQLETFFDVSHLSNIQFSENPIPVFTELHNKYSSGYLSVPSIGAGTANTEFEIISGMSLEYFGVGEYPYKTILQSSPSESVCYNLVENGYTNHAIHNNTAVFYDRNIVFSNLGFNTFTSVEYMQDVEYTETGWAKDDVLVGCITDALNSTDGPDMVYTITVQSHGKYPSEYDRELPISVTGIADEETKREFEYYINELNSVDKFIGDLVTTLHERDEETVVVMFGDHLPSFDISAEDLANGDLFQTEYIIWDNFGLQKQDSTVASYQLASKTLGLVGIDSGLINRLHQNFAENSNYHKWLEVLEYDMLYGQKYAWGGAEKYPYKPTPLKMGVKDVVIHSVEIIPNENQLKVTGSNFTEFSKVFLNNSECETALIDNNTLVVLDDIEFVPGDIISVSQVDKESTRLSTTNDYIIGGTMDDLTVSVDTDNIIYRKRGLKTLTSIAIIVSSIAVISAAVVIVVLTKRKRKVN